jgi:cytochrome bd-type quinol oxidase subunit 2
LRCRSAAHGKGPSRIRRVQRLFYRHSWWGGLRAHPILLLRKHGSALCLTIENAKTGVYSFSLELILWLVGIALAIVYFTFLVRFFRGKAHLTDDG